MILYMIRHGETDWNRVHLFQGTTDVPLNDNGRKVARLTKEALKAIPFDAVFTSPLSRARETAEILMEGRDIPVQVENRIIEICFGDYEGFDMNKRDEDLETYFERPHLYQDKMGVEPFENILKRCGDFLEELKANPAYKDSNILISTHGGILRGLICVLKKNGIDKYWEGGVHKNCGMTIVEIKGEEIRFLEESVIWYDEADL